MEYLLNKILPPLLQVVATFIVFVLGYIYSEKTRKDERTLVKADRVAEEKKKKEKLKLMLSEELKENYPILLDLTQINPLEFRPTDNIIGKLSFSVYQEYLYRFDALEPREVKKILAAYSFMKQIVDPYKKQVSPDHSNSQIYLEWIGNLQSNLETVETALEFLGYGEEFVIDSLLQAIAESKVDGYYFYICKKVAEFGNRVVPHLNELLESDRKIVRDHASEALKQIGTPEALKAVEEYEKRKKDEAQLG